MNTETKEATAENVIVTEQSATTAIPATGTAEVAVLDTLTQELIADAGIGQEFGTDLAIPYLSIIQKGSPQVDENSGKYIVGAKAGMVFNTVSNELFDCRTKDGKLVDGAAALEGVLSGYNKAFVEWLPNRGGFAGQHAESSPAVKTRREVEVDGKRKVKMAGSDNDLVETGYHYFTLGAPSPFPKWTVIAMSSSQLKVSKRLNTVSLEQRHVVGGKAYRLPIYGTIFTIKTKLETRDENNWFGWLIEANGVVNDRELFEAGKAYQKAIAAGLAKVSAPPSDLDEKSGAPDDKDIPF